MIGGAAIAEVCGQLLKEARDLAAKEDWHEVHIKWMQVFALKRVLTFEKSKSVRMRDRVEETLNAIEALNLGVAE